MKKTDSGLKIVSVGGGTGLSTLLSGLKAFVGKESLSNADLDARWVETLTAVVTVTELARLVLETHRAERLAAR